MIRYWYIGYPLFLLMATLASIPAKMVGNQFYCWPLNATAKRPTPFPTCPGMTANWLYHNDIHINPKHDMLFSYRFMVNSSFFVWAVSKGLFDNAGPSGFKNAKEAERWCLETTCPSTYRDANASNCCLYHVNVMFCPGNKDDPHHPCRPWLPEVGTVIIQSHAQYGPVNTSTWKSLVTSSSLPTRRNMTVLAVFKLGAILAALEGQFVHKYDADCGNGNCEEERGETCTNCPADCERCNLQVNEIFVLVVSLLGFLIVTAFIIVAYYRWKKQMNLKDETWIVNPGEVFANFKDLNLSEDHYICAIDRSEELVYPTISHMVPQYGTRRKTLSIHVPVAMVQLSHPNLCLFVGGTTLPGSVYILYEYCPKGSLLDVLQNDTISLNWAFRFSMLADVVRGMAYLHKNNMVHGNLKSSNCVVDDRWICKVTDFGLKEYRRESICSEDEDDLHVRHEEKWIQDKVYRAPEVETNPQPASDVFSFAVIMIEVSTREKASEISLVMSDQNNLQVLKRRPSLPCFLSSSTSLSLDSCIIFPNKNSMTEQRKVFFSKYLDLINKCLMEKPSDRPDFWEVEESLECIYPRKKNPVDTMMALMQMYSKNLEALVEKRSRQLLEEKQKTEALLHSILPRAVADSLRNGKQVRAECFEASTVFFSDIVAFTTLSSRSTPMQIVELLNRLYTTFDSIIGKYDVYKVETIGDAYMVVSGVPHRTERHAFNVASMALGIMAVSKLFVIPHLPGENLLIKAGLHSGPVCAGVVGVTMPRYCLFGDTVNTASRMETYSKGGCIHISSATHTELEPAGIFIFEQREKIDVKGKGEMFTWWLKGLRDNAECLSSPHVQCDLPIGGVEINILTNAYSE